MLEGVFAVQFMPVQSGSGSLEIGEIFDSAQLQMYQSGHKLYEIISSRSHGHTTSVGGDCSY